MLPIFVHRIRPRVVTTDFGFQNRPAGTPPNPPRHTCAKPSTNSLGSCWSPPAPPTRAPRHPNPPPRVRPKTPNKIMGAGEIVWRFGGRGVRGEGRGGGPGRDRARALILARALLWVFEGVPATVKQPLRVRKVRPRVLGICPEAVFVKLRCRSAGECCRSAGESCRSASRVEQICEME